MKKPKFYTGIIVTVTSLVWLVTDTLLYAHDVIPRPYFTPLAAVLCGLGVILTIWGYDETLP